MRIAFFDLDKTILAKNSATLWVRAERKSGNLSAWQAMRAGVWLFRYSLGAANLEDAVRESIATLTGSIERELIERAARFWEESVRPFVRPGALAAIAEHRQRGDRVVLLTSSSSYLSEPVVRDLGLDDALCTRLEVDASGCFTGKPVEPICFGPGKLTLARAYVESLGASLEACVFYSDSASDIPMLEAVGTPVAVNPDPRLRRVAKSRGWRITDWGEPRA